MSFNLLPDHLRAELTRCLEQQERLMANVVLRRGGGYYVRLLDDTVSAFLPDSLSLVPPHERFTTSLAGTTTEVVIVECPSATDPQGRLVVSRVVAWRQRTAAALAALVVGEVVQARVAYHTPEGLSVRYGELKGWVAAKHVLLSELPDPLAWPPPDTEVPVRIIEVAPEYGKFQGSIRACLAEVAAQTPLRYTPGDRVLGRIATITNFGLFVELVPGTVALVHRNGVGMPPGGRLIDYFAIGEPLFVVIETVDATTRRLAARYTPPAPLQPLPGRPATRPAPGPEAASPTDSQPLIPDSSPGTPPPVPAP